MLVGQILVDFTVIRLLKSEFRCVTYVLCETLCVTQTGRKSPLALLHLSVKTKEANYHRSTGQLVFFQTYFSGLFKQ